MTSVRIVAEWPERPDDLRRSAGALAEILKHLSGAFGTGPFLSLNARDLRKPFAGGDPSAEGIVGALLADPYAVRREGVRFVGYTTAGFSEGPRGGVAFELRGGAEDLPGGIGCNRLEIRIDDPTPQAEAYVGTAGTIVRSLDPDYLDVHRADFVHLLLAEGKEPYAPIGGWMSYVKGDPDPVRGFETRALDAGALRVNPVPPNDVEAHQALGLEGYADLRPARDARYGAI